MYSNRGRGVNSSSVGQRRGPQMANFVSGGQLNPPKKPVVSMPGTQQNNQSSQQNNQNSQQNNQQSQMQQQPLQGQQAGQRKQLLPNQPSPVQPPLNRPSPVQPPLNRPSPVQPPVISKPPVIQQRSEQPNLIKDEDLEIVDEVMNDGDEEQEKKPPRKSKPFWIRKDGKINKREQRKRRNQRLRKILQPKNALMVLNEIIGSTPYNLSDNLDMYEGTLFKCSVLVDGIEHTGVGKSKPTAKTAAAEAALKYMVLSKLKSRQQLDAALNTTTANESANSDISDKPMEIDENVADGISWSHVACYALHKLLNSWDDGTNFVEKLTQVASGGGSTVSVSDNPQAFEKKPAKKLPQNANVMNPIMLLNQMQPLALYEEVQRTGDPPNMLFSFKCTVGTHVFVGTSSTKKGARKMCAFAACRKILGINYTPEFLAEHGFTEDAVKYSQSSTPMSSD